jgi:transposase
MVTLGVDAHKRTHTVVAVDERGRQLAVKTVRSGTKDHLGLLTWAEQIARKAGDGGGLLWGIEDCRHLSRRLERDLLAAGQSIVRVPPKLMAHARDSARTYGKSDPIDALAVARAAQREPGLPVARLDGPDRDVRLLADHRESLVAERTRVICRLRWHLHELDPDWEPKARSLDRISVLDQVEARIAGLEGTVARLAHTLTGRCRELTAQINELTAELTGLICVQAPALIAIPGCGALTAAKILGETAGVDRFRSKDAYARHNGTAPLPVWSSNKAHHRLSRTGNRQLNAALHRIAMTQAHWHPAAKDLMTRRKTGGDSGLEALRVLKRRLSDVVYAALHADLTAKQHPAPVNDSAAAA